MLLHRFCEALLPRALPCICTRYMCCAYFVLKSLTPSLVCARPYTNSLSCCALPLLPAESTSIAGQVQVSAAFAEVLRVQWPEAQLESRGVQQIKGKG